MMTIQDLDLGVLHVWFSGLIWFDNRTPNRKSVSQIMANNDDENNSNKDNNNNVTIIMYVGLPVQISLGFLALG